MPQLMRCLQDLERAGVLAVGQTAASLVSSRKIPVFTKIDREHQALYRHYRRVLVRKECLSTTSSDPQAQISSRNLGRIAHRSTGVYRWRSKGSEFIGPISKLPGRLERANARKLPLAKPPRPRKIEFEMGFEGYEKDALFLRVDDRVLSEIDLSGTCNVSVFKDGGYSHPRPFEIVGQTRGGYSIKKPSDYVESKLEAIAFDHAFLVNKEGLKNAAAGRAWAAGPVPPKAFRIEVRLRVEDLWLLSSDFDKLVRQTSQDRELVAYPFDHKDTMPGLYWMYQAAYAHNHLRNVAKAENGVKKWLLEHAPNKTYRFGSVRTAEKFVWRAVDRKQGAEGRGEFVIEDLDEWTVAEDYKVDFISKGFSVVLAVADWWMKMLSRDPREPPAHLADKLTENNFSGLEVGDLVYLISGSKFTYEDMESLEIRLRKKSIEQAKKAAKSSTSL